MIIKLLFILLCLYLPYAHGLSPSTINRFNQDFRQAIKDLDADRAQKLVEQLGPGKPLDGVYLDFVLDVYSIMMSPSRLVDVPHWEAVLETAFAAGLDPRPQLPRILELWAKNNSAQPWNAQRFGQTAFPLVKAISKAASLGPNDKVVDYIDNVKREFTLMQYAYMADWPIEQTNFDALEARFSHTNRMFYYFISPRSKLNETDYRGWNIVMTLAYFGDIEALEKLWQVYPEKDLVNAIRFQSDGRGGAGRQSPLDLVFEPMAYGNNSQRVKKVIQRLMWYGANPGLPGAKDNIVERAKTFAQ